ncbi:hypothetical protein Bbelb_431810 [Branchiostoma belcheri]|nr:hypothetical protein Bbelb_435890 [Branchiostoma belcheri]KAI8479093.1 hypothetical protein Bbelb_431810 [Branchiostoma belcheri]
MYRDYAAQVQVRASRYRMMRGEVSSKAHLFEGSRSFSRDVKEVGDPRSSRVSISVTVAVIDTLTETGYESANTGSVSQEQNPLRGNDVSRCRRQGEDIFGKSAKGESQGGQSQQELG